MPIGLCAVTDLRYAGSINVDKVWQSFFQQAEALGIEKVKKGLLPRVALQEMDPEVVLGLPALVMLRALQVHHRERLVCS